MYFIFTNNFYCYHITVHRQTAHMVLDRKPLNDCLNCPFDPVARLPAFDNRRIVADEVGREALKLLLGNVKAYLEATFSRIVLYGHIYPDRTPG